MIAGRGRYAGRALQAALLTALLAVPAAASRPELVAVPEPVLDRMDPAVRAQLTERRALVDALIADPSGDDQALGAELGRLGGLYLAYELVDEARAALENAHRLAPGDARWLYYLALGHQQHGDLEAAAERYRAYLARQPSSVAGWIRLGEVELRRGRAADAADAFTRAQALPGGADAAHYGLGRLAYQDGRFAQAAEHFRAVLAAQPEASAVHYQLGLAYRELDQLEAARTHLGQHGTVEVGFPDPLQQAISEQTTGAGVLLTHGYTALRQGRLDLARRFYRDAVDADPDNVSARIALGAMLAGAGDYPGAVAHFEAAREREPENPLVLANLGSCLLEVGQAAAAIARYRQALAIAPDYRDARRKLASALVQAGQGEAAAAELETLIAADPRDADGRRMLARVLRRLDRPAAAAEQLEQLLAEHPDDHQARLLRAETRLDGGDLAAAASDYRTVHDAPRADRPTRAAASVGLGNVASLRGDPAAAIAHYRRAIEEHADGYLAHFQLANALARGGRLDDAAAHYAEATATAPSFVPAHQRHAQALLLAGRPAEALAALEAGVAAAPEAVELTHDLARLLATLRRADLRDGARALRLAQQALAARRTVDHEETVAMAHAELGDFATAVAWQERVIETTRRAGRDDLLPAQLARLAAYRRGAPWRTPPGP